MSCSRSRFCRIACILLVFCVGPAAFAGASLDIRPSACPNIVNRDARGLVAVVLVSDMDFAASRVDVSSLQLTRGDGVGGTALPLPGRRGIRAVALDLAAPAVSGMCSTFGVDGLVDLRLMFGQAQIVDNLELAAVAPNTTVELCLSGQSFTGTPFSVCDDVIVVELAPLFRPRLDDLGEWQFGTRDR